MMKTKGKMKFRKSAPKFTAKQILFRKQTDRQRLGEIQGFVDFCFTEMTEGKKALSMAKIAKKTDLSLCTVYALKRGDYTTCVRASTLQKLGHAVGAKLFPVTAE